MNRLPNELLLEIFAYLEYTDLRLSISAACGHFQSLLSNSHATKTGPIDRALFRDKPREACIPPQLSQPKVHPALSSFRCPRQSDLQPGEDLRSCSDLIVRKLPQKGRRISHTNAWRENAVSPAVEKLALNIEGRNRIMVDGDGGVTVKNVGDALCMARWAGILGGDTWVSLEVGDQEKCVTSVDENTLSLIVREQRC